MHTVYGNNSSTFLWLQQSAHYFVTYWESLPASNLPNTSSRSDNGSMLNTGRIKEIPCLIGDCISHIQLLIKQWSQHVLRDFILLYRVVSLLTDTDMDLLYGRCFDRWRTWLREPTMALLQDKGKRRDGSNRLSFSRWQPFVLRREALIVWLLQRRSMGCRFLYNPNSLLFFSSDSDNRGDALICSITLPFSWSRHWLT